MPDGSAYLGGGIGLGPAWKEPVDVINFPEPEIPGHDVDPWFMGKQAVMDLYSLAVNNGWTVRVVHAKGSVPHATNGTPGPQRHSISLRMSRGEGRMVAVYREGSTWAWDTMYLLDGRLPRKISLVTELKVALAAKQALTK